MFWVILFHIIFIFVYIPGLGALSIPQSLKTKHPLLRNHKQFPSNLLWKLIWTELGVATKPLTNLVPARQVLYILKLLPRG